MDVRSLVATGLPVRSRPGSGPRAEEEYFRRWSSASPDPRLVWGTEAVPTVLAFASACLVVFVTTMVLT